MPIFEIYSKYLRIKYKSSVCSKATLFVLVCNIFSVIIPFVLAYYSKGFWLKVDMFSEQPRVRFKGEYLFEATTTNLSRPILCNTFPMYQKYSNLDLCSAVKVRQIDTNEDKKMDMFEFVLNVLLEDLTITSLLLIIMFDYELQSTCKLCMDSAAVLQYSLNSKVHGITVYSELKLSQSKPIYCFGHGEHSQRYPKLNNENIEDYKAAILLKEYFIQNISTHFANVYTVYTGGIQRHFVLNLLIKIPEHVVYYKPRFWQIIKWAWIQYLATSIVIVWLIAKIKDYVFDNKLVLYYEVSPIKK